jgi:outer membrane protein TolC
MTLPRFHTFIITSALCAGLFAPTASAEQLPWLPAALSDPFAAQQKASRMVDLALKPDSCQGHVDFSSKLQFNDVVIAALCNNPDAKAAYLGLIADAATYVSNYSSYLPAVTGSTGWSRTTSFVDHTTASHINKAYGLSTSLTLYDFGQREFKLEVAEFTLAAAGHSYNYSLQGMIETALNGYYQLLTAQNAVGVAKESERYAKESYEAAAIQHKIGLVPHADELSAKGTYSSAILATEQAENQLKQARSSLAVFMGISATSPIQVAEIDNKTLAHDPFDGKVEMLIEEAKRKRADLLASRLQLKGSEASLRALERADLATISATANIDQSQDNPYIFNRSASRSQAIGLSVSVPFFTGFSQTYSEMAARKGLEAQRDELDKSELGVEQDVWNSWQNYDTAKRSWATSADLMASATQLKDVALGRYKEGLGTILDVLNAQSQYSAALQSQLQARYSLLSARVDLVRAVGLLDLDTMQPEASVAVTPVNNATATNE